MLKKCLNRYFSKEGIHEKQFIIINHQGFANPNYSEIPIYTYYDSYNQKAR
jgi:hypothetical protein